MRILHISSLYYPAQGGAEILTRWTSEKIASLGHDISVFTSQSTSQEDFYHFNSNPPNLKEREMINGVDVRRFNVDPFLGRFYSADTTRFFGMYRLQRIFAGDNVDFYHHGPILTGLVEAIGLHKPDVLVAINNYPWTTYAAYLAKIQYGIPFVIFPMTHVSNSWAFADPLKKVLKSADRLIVSTEFEKRYLVDQGVLSSIIFVKGHPVDLKDLNSEKVDNFRRTYHIPNDVPVIVYLGRKVNGKGIEFLVEAMRLVWKTFPEARLILAGKTIGAFKAILESQLSALDHDQRQRVINIDSFDEADKVQIYDAADIFAMASNVDSFGIVYLEAWARGLPVIAARGTAQESFIQDGKDGVLVDYGSAESLADGIGRLIRDKALAKQLGQSGKRKVFEEYSVDKYAAGVIDVYKSL